MTGIASQNRLSTPLKLSVVVAVLLVVAAVPGIFVGDLYRDTPSIVATDRGADLFTLIAIVPALAISILYSRRASLRAQVVWLGLMAWIAYNYIVYAYGLNFSRASLVHVAIVSLAIFTIVLVIRRVDIAAVGRQFRPSMPRRVVAAYLWLVAAIFSFLWLSDTIPATVTGGIPPRLAELHTTSNPVEINDLAVIVPTFVLAGVWTWQRRPLGYMLSGILLGLAAITMTAIVPGGPIFAGQSVDPLYAGIAVVSFILWIVFLVNVGVASAHQAESRPSPGQGSAVGLYS